MISLNDQIEELDEETKTIINLKEEFETYLQEQTNMLEEKKENFNNKEFEKFDEKNVSLKLKNIIHSAINTNAKQKLTSLFKDLDLLF